MSIYYDPLWDERVEVNNTIAQILNNGGYSVGRNEIGTTIRSIKEAVMDAYGESFDFDGCFRQVKRPCKQTRYRSMIG